MKQEQDNYNFFIVFELARW